MLYSKCVTNAVILLALAKDTRKRILVRYNGVFCAYHIIVTKGSLPECCLSRASRIPMHVHKGRKVKKRDTKKMMLART